jgi:hypothetical protein
MTTPIDSFLEGILLILLVSEMILAAAVAARLTIQRRATLR